MTAKVFKVVGSDRDIVMTSRVATDRTDKPLSDDQVDKAIKNLIKSRHWSPFEFGHLYIDVEAPIYVMRQWMRHPRPFIEKSRRYTKDDPRYDEQIEDIYAVQKAGECYKGSLAKGVKPEDARKVLPVGTYTHVLWNPNIRDFLFFLNARLSDHAQREIRELAQSLYDQFKTVFPSTAKWFAEYELGQISFSIEELQSLLDTLRGVRDEYRLGHIEERIVTNAQNRITMVERVLAGASQEVSDSSEDSSSDGDTPTDS